MRSRLVLQLVLVVGLVASACSDDSGSTTVAATAPAATSAPATTSAPSTTSAPATTTATTSAPVTTAAPATTAATSVGSNLVIIQVGFDTSFQEGWVILQNTGDADAFLSDHFLCQRPSYFALPDMILAPGEIVWVENGAPSNRPETIGAGDAVGTFDVSGGEVALYSSRNFDDPSAILSYVEWGSAGHGRSSVAVAAGLWGAGDFVDLPPPTTPWGAILVIDEDGAPGVANWEPLEAP